MKKLLLLPIIAFVGGCVADPYYDEIYTEQTNYQYIPSGSSMIYTETIVRPQIYTNPYPVYVQPRPYYRPAPVIYYPPRPYWNSGFNNRDHYRPNYRPDRHDNGNWGRPNGHGNGNWNNNHGGNNNGNHGKPDRHDRRD